MLRWTDPVKHAVEQTWNHREDGWPQCFQIIHQKFNVALEKADSSPVDQDDALMETESCLHKHTLMLVELVEPWHAWGLLESHTELKS